MIKNTRTTRPPESTKQASEGLTDTEAATTEVTWSALGPMHARYGCLTWSFCWISNSGNGGISDSYLIVGPFSSYPFPSFDMMVCA